MSSASRRALSSRNVGPTLEVPALAVDTERGLALVRARAARPSFRRVPVRWLQGLAATGAVVLVASTLTLSGFAGSLLTIFEPQKFVAIPIDPSDLRVAGGLERYGALTGGGAQPKPMEVADAAAARAASGFAAAIPGTLPAGVGAQRWAVLPETSATFTFSASAARGAAAAAGRTAPPMPAGMDGSRLVLTTGAAVLQTWAGAQAGGGAAPSGGPGKAATPELPALFIAQLRAPTVASDGVTVNELQAYLLAQPGISPALPHRSGRSPIPHTPFPSRYPRRQARRT